MAAQRTWRTTYTPGSWLVLNGPQALVTARPSSSAVAARLASIWADVVAATDLESLVGRLMHWGMDVVPDLIVVVEADGLSCVVRGALEVHDAETGAVVADGRGQTAWRSVKLDTRHITIELPGETVGGVRLPLAVGVVSAGSIEVDARDNVRVDIRDQSMFVTPPNTEVPPVAVVAPIAAPVAAPVVVPVVEVPVAQPMPTPLPQPQPLPEPMPAPQLAPLPQPEPIPVPQPELVPQPMPVPEEMPAPVLSIVPDPGPVEVPQPVAAEQVGGEPVDPRNFDWWHPEPNALPASATAGQPMPGQPMVVPQPVMQQPIMQQPVMQSPEPEPAPMSAEPEFDEPDAVGSPTGATELVFSDGQRVPVGDPLLVGRAPQPFPGEEATLIRVASPHHDISRTHVRIELYDGAIWATDRESTNGTIVHNPGQQPVTATPNQPCHVWVGGLVDLGDGMSIRVQ